MNKKDYILSINRAIDYIHDFDLKPEAPGIDKYSDTNLAAHIRRGRNMAGNSPD